MADTERVPLRNIAELETIDEGLYAGPCLGSPFMCEDTKAHALNRLRSRHQPLLALLVACTTSFAGADEDVPYAARSRYACTLRVTASSVCQLLTCIRKFEVLVEFYYALTDSQEFASGYIHQNPTLCECRMNRRIARTEVEE